MKTYVGIRRPDGGCLVAVGSGGEQTALDPRFDLWNHSPTGFEWGYSGSGPAQLALALLADALQQDALAIMLYQQFKREIVSRLPAYCWTLNSGEICQWALNAAEDMLLEGTSLESLADESEGEYVIL